MLNEYWGTAVPVVLERHGGMIERFAGDAVMVVFNAVTRPARPRAARGRRRARAAGAVRRARAGDTRTGRGSAPGSTPGGRPSATSAPRQQRSFAVIGDTTNTAARLQAAARPGRGRDRRGDARRARRRRGGRSELTPIEAKGKREPGTGVPARAATRPIGSEAVPRPKEDDWLDVTFTWLGHSAFRIDTPGGKRIYVDPFLEGNPKCPDTEKEPERVDVIAITHGHGDHVGTRRRARERALAGRRRDRSSSRLARRDRARRTGPSCGTEQGRHGRRRRHQGHADRREPLGRPRTDGLDRYLGEPGRARGRARGRHEASTSPATRTSSATWS